MTTLTPDQLIEARVYLEGIKKIQALGEERMARAKEPFDSKTEELAYVAVTNALFTALEQLVDEIAEKLAGDLFADDKLAEVIDILDGNRRKTRLR